ncbi:uncharacterized protein LOC128994950 [Macrosteles quadrilineatus]|uniref:uncharacterized protein LOC128994950 n=1 Tax=Macrosteles quadrilineatus TaxID=74068 RepID=UPI0023E3262F|nr:uncharacterized protein LOC128994950 [Macrosteles quadrilineatus]XP_054275777.1 uncharacterized protein LOC128994950 [Macrosteles quadrilineatus]
MMCNTLLLVLFALSVQNIPVSMAGGEKDAQNVDTTKDQAQNAETTNDQAQNAETTQDKAKSVDTQSVDTPKDKVQTEETPKDPTQSVETQSVDTPKDKAQTEETPKDPAQSVETQSVETQSVETPKVKAQTEETPKDQAHHVETPSLQGQQYIKDTDDNLKELKPALIEILISKFKKVGRLDEEDIKYEIQNFYYGAGWRYFKHATESSLHKSVMTAKGWKNCDEVETAMVDATTIKWSDVETRLNGHATPMNDLKGILEKVSREKLQECFALLFTDRFCGNLREKKDEVKP